MAITTHEIPAEFSRKDSESGWSFFNWLVRLGDRMYATSLAAECAFEAARMAEMTDEQLDRIGVKREDIVRHAFRKLPLY